MPTDLFHGAHTDLAIHEGQCWTEDYEAADRYAQSEGPVAHAEIDLSGLTVEECEGYNHDENDAPADSAEFRAAATARGVDVLVYADCDEQGQEHTCYRIVSDRAVEAFRAAHAMLERDEYGDIIAPW